jgi:chemotaxis response regulator CheB
VAPCERGALEKHLDRFLESIARSFGPRAIGVVLTGMGSDGALGARRLHLAGGRVLVQSESSAEAAEMPKAAIKVGAADL